MSTEDQKQKLLTKSFLFSQLQSEDLHRLVRFSKFRKVSPKEVVFHRADPGGQMSIISKGRVKLSILSDEGKEITFGILEVGDIFGEIALLDGEQRSATVTALESTELLVIDRRDFIPFLENNPKVAINLLSTLASRLRMTNEMFEDTVFRNLPARLAKKFLYLGEKYGNPMDGGTKITLKLSQQEIGNLVATSRESVNKQMRAWEEQGLISFQNGYLVILNAAALTSLTKIGW